MKKYLFAASVLLFLCMPITAQKYFDVYQNGRVANSIASTSIDSIGLTGNSMQDHKVNFYSKGKIVNSYYVSTVDSIKVFRTDEEQLVYLGIVGFNQELYEKPIDVLATSTAYSYTSFVRDLARKDGTLLYYAVDHAIDMLDKKDFQTPLTSVSLVTFTDGLDQGSLMMNGNYSTDEQYLDAVNKRISYTNVKGIPLTAYSVGLRGSDVTDYRLFQKNLNKLASSPEKAFEVNDMDAVRSRLKEICDQILSISTRQTFSLKIPGQSNGTLIRFTFDKELPEDSKLYIEGTFNLSTRSLTNVTYHGLKATSGSFVQGTQDGIFVTFTFTGMQRADGNGLIPQNDIKEYYKTSGSLVWQQNSEFTPSNNTQTTITHSGAAIMLVLDCSNSLGTQFGDMKSYAQDFINTVASNTQDFKVEAPANITASLTDDFVIQVSWDAVKHAESYDVYRSSYASGNFTKVATGLKETTWIDEYPLAGNNYYRVNATGHGLSSPNSSTSNVVYYGLEAPTSAKAVIPDDAFVIQVSWNGVEHAESYDVYRSNNSSNGFTKVATGLVQTSWTDNSPLSGSNYYRVYAIGHGLVSGASNTTSVVNYALDAPSNATATIPNDAFIINVTWNGVQYAESYSIYRSNISNGTFTQVASNVTSTFWTDSSPLVGNNCYYICAVGHGLISSASNKTNLVDYSIASPSNAKAILNENFEVVVSWNTVKYAEGYEVYRSSNSSTGFTKVVTGLKAEQWKDPSPLHGSNYYRIYAVANDIVSNPSNTTNVVNYSIAAPSNVTAYIPDNEFVIKISWGAVTYAESYDIYRGNNSSGGFTKIATGIITTQWTDSNPLHGNNYYRIYAVGHGLTSEPSNTSAVVNYSLDVPQNLIATYNSDENSVSLSWNTVKHAEGYEVYRGDELVAGPIPINSWKDTNPPLGKVIYSVCSVGHGLKSENASVSVVAGRPTTVGWASVGSLTTGGNDENAVIVTTLSQLNNALEQAQNRINEDAKNKMTIYVKGQIETNGYVYVEGVKNLTIYGLPGSSMINNNRNEKNKTGIMFINGCENIIIRNMTFKGAGAYDIDGNDNLTINSSSHVWIDHCDFQDGVDGNFDCINQSNYITVSWCRFRYLIPPKTSSTGASNDHRFSNQWGDDDKAADNGCLNTTFACCWWDEGCRERMPRIRFGKVHILNCLYSSSVATYCIGAGYRCNAYVENCAFTSDKTKKTPWKNCATIGSYTDYNITLCGNKGAGDAQKRSGNIDFFIPSEYYNYEVYDVNNVESMVSNQITGAGATLDIKEGEPFTTSNVGF